MFQNTVFILQINFQIYHFLILSIQNKYNFALISSKEISKKFQNTILILHIKFRASVIVGNVQYKKL
jgi:hypothetical protein